MKNVIFLFLSLIYGRLPVLAQKDPVWDNTKDKHWGNEFVHVQIPSPTDGAMQNAWFYPSSKATGQPLIISLHTWSGDYNQEDPLAKEIVEKDWNYIHPDFRGANNKPDACGSPLVISDLLDVIHFVIKNAKVDTANVHIIGVSGGGYLALLAYMKLDYPVKSFNAWAPISDLQSWYWESKGRHNKYANDLENVAKEDGVINWKELQKRSPLFLTFPHERRKNTIINIYEGVHDGYTGSVPISHSILFYNKVAKALYPTNKNAVVTDSVWMSILIKQCNPDADSSLRIGDRIIHLKKELPGLSLILFEGGHEMIVPRALDLIPITEVKKH